MVLQQFQKIVGRNIKEARNKIGMKGETLANEIGVSKSTISLLENGKIDINVSTLHKIATILKVDICSLVALDTVQTIKDFENRKRKEHTVLIERSVVDELLNTIQSLSNRIGNGN